MVHQIAAPDVVGWGLVLAGAQSESGGTVALGVAGILLGGPIVGAGLGYVAAAAVDIIYLAREDVPEATPRMFSIGGRF